MERDPLLAEKWERAAQEQGAETAESKGVDLYYSFLEKARKNSELAPIVTEVEKAIGSYADAILRMAEVRHLHQDKEALMAADQHRRLTHESLISAINQLSRAYAAQKIDNKWRRDIIGLDRKAVGEWALEVARHVLGKTIPS